MSVLTDQIAADAQALTEAMRAGCADPTDAIRILGALLVTPLPLQTLPSAVAAQVLVSNLFCGAALASMALACADYQPASSTEANAMIDQVGALLDAQIVAAADNGLLSTYNALRDLRQAVITDLQTRSATLPELVTVTLPGNLPSLALAYRLYQDTSREPGLVARADVVHPGFMASSFEALSA